MKTAQDSLNSNKEEIITVCAQFENPIECEQAAGLYRPDKNGEIIRFCAQFENPRECERTAGINRFTESDYP